MAVAENFLVLVISSKGEPAARERLSAALSAAPFASVLLKPSPEDTPQPAFLKSLVEEVQKRESAALVADDAALARMLRADGVHLSWSRDILARFAAAREMLGERFIIGADAGRSKHDAMELAEAGASYVAFGIPPHVEDRETAFARQIGLIEWWSEIFEIPSVAFDALDAEHAAALAAAGADFVTLTLEAGIDAKEVAPRVNAFATALSTAKVTA